MSELHKVDSTVLIQTGKNWLTWKLAKVTEQNASQYVCQVLESGDSIIVPDKKIRYKDYIDLGNPLQILLHHLKWGEKVSVLKSIVQHFGMDYSVIGPRLLLESVICCQIAVFSWVLNDLQVSIKSVDDCGRNILHLAVMKKQHNFIKWFYNSFRHDYNDDHMYGLEDGVDYKKMNLLHYLVLNGDEEITRWCLIECEPLYNTLLKSSIWSRNGATNMHICDWKDDKGRSSIDYARAFKRKAIIDLLNNFRKQSVIKVFLNDLWYKSCSKKEYSILPLIEALTANGYHNDGVPLLYDIADDFTAMTFELARNAILENGLRWMVDVWGINLFSLRCSNRIQRIHAFEKDIISQVVKGPTCQYYSSSSFRSECSIDKPASEEIVLLEQLMTYFSEAFYDLLEQWDGKLDILEFIIHQRTKKYEKKNMSYRYSSINCEFEYLNMRCYAGGYGEEEAFLSHAEAKDMRQIAYAYCDQFVSRWQGVKIEERKLILHWLITELHLSLPSADAFVKWGQYHLLEWAVSENYINLEQKLISTHDLYQYANGLVWLTKKDCNVLTVAQFLCSLAVSLGELQIFVWIFTDKIVNKHFTVAGMNMLHFSTYMGQYVVMKWLIANKHLSVSSVTPNGQNISHLAMKMNRPTVGLYLVNEFKDLFTVKDTRNRTALDFVEKCSDARISEWHQKHLQLKRFKSFYEKLVKQPTISTKTISKELAELDTYNIFATEKLHILEVYPELILNYYIKRVNDNKQEHLKTAGDYTIVILVLCIEQGRKEVFMKFWDAFANKDEFCLISFLKQCMSFAQKVDQHSIYLLAKELQISLMDKKTNKDRFYQLYRMFDDTVITGGTVDEFESIIAQMDALGNGNEKIRLSFESFKNQVKENSHTLVVNQNRSRLLEFCFQENYIHIAEWILFRIGVSDIKVLVSTMNNLISNHDNLEMLKILLNRFFALEQKGSSGFSKAFVSQGLHYLLIQSLGSIYYIDADINGSRPRLGLFYHLLSHCVGRSIDLNVGVVNFYDNINNTRAYYLFDSLIENIASYPEPALWEMLNTLLQPIYGIDMSLCTERHSTIVKYIITASLDAAAYIVRRQKQVNTITTQSSTTSELSIAHETIATVATTSTKIDSNKVGHTEEDIESEINTSVVKNRFDQNIKLVELLSNKQMAFGKDPFEGYKLNVEWNAHTCLLYVKFLEYFSINYGYDTSKIVLYEPKDSYHDIIQRIIRDQKERWSLAEELSKIDSINRPFTYFEAQLSSDNDKKHYTTAVYEKGRSLLHIAALSNNIEVCKLLVEMYHMDMLAKDQEGNTVQQLAQKAGSATVAKFIRNTIASQKLLRFVKSKFYKSKQQKRIRIMTFSATLIQKMYRGHTIFRRYNPYLKAVQGSWKGFVALWGEVMSLLEGKLDTHNNATWSAIKMEYDMLESVCDRELFDISAKLNNFALLEFAKTDVEVSSSIEGGYCTDHELVRIDSSRSTIVPKANIELSHSVVKWLAGADSKYRELFTSRLSQLATGHRSYAYSKQLKHCTRGIYETKLDSGQRILWTNLKRGSEQSILVWFVAKHDAVSICAKYIGKSFDRMVSRPEVLQQLEEVQSLFLDDNTVLLDPTSNAPLKTHLVSIGETQLLNRVGWVPPLRLSSKQNEINQLAGTILLLGRSGTGKTVCLSDRMKRDRIRSDGICYQLFVSRNKRLCDFVRMYQTEQSGDKSNLINTRFMILDQFIPHMEETICVVKNNNRSVFLQSKRVDFQRFKAILNTLKIRLSLDPIIIWTQIRSFIKGSLETVLQGCHLTHAQYHDLNIFSSERCRLNSSQRTHAYEIYLRYADHLSNEQLWDDADRVLKLLNHSGLEPLCACNGNGADFQHVYVDEVQDNTQAEIVLYFLAVGMNVNGMFLAGDPAQSVIEGVDFRFEDVRSIVYKLSNGKERLQRAVKLNVNYRSHSGILNCAAAILDKMFRVFPGSAKVLPKDEGLFKGPRPSYNTNFSTTALVSVLSRNQRFVVICNDSQVKSVEDDLSNAGLVNLVLGIRAAKGLEFQDIVLFDFFSNVSSADHKAWKAIFSEESCEASYSYPHVEAQLKLLYTAITRSCNRLLFVESQATSLTKFFFRWLKDNNLAESLTANTEEETFFMTSDEWRVRGIELVLSAEGDYASYFLQQALKCFERAGDTKLKNKASAHQLIFVQSNKLLGLLDTILQPKYELEVSSVILIGLRYGLVEEVSKLCELLTEKVNGKQFFKELISNKLKKYIQN